VRRSGQEEHLPSKFYMDGGKSVTLTRVLVHHVRVRVRTRVMVWTQVWGVPGESLRCPGTAWPCGRIFSFGPGTTPVTSTLTVALSSGYCSSFGSGPLRSRTLACFSFRYVAARLDLKPMARTD